MSSHSSVSPSRLPTATGRSALLSLISSLPLCAMCAEVSSASHAELAGERDEVKDLAYILKRMEQAQQSVLAGLKVRGCVRSCCR